MMKYLKIPKERVGVLIGHNGETKQRIETISQTVLDIDSNEGEVSINDENVTDPLMPLKVLDVVKAIGRGFSPDRAMRLFDEGAELFIFDIHDYVGKKPTHIRRLKSRIIGKEGKTKRVIEEITGSSLSVYGHTISVIADALSMDVARRAVDMLLSGSKHATVYRFVEREMKKIRLGDLL